MCIRDRSLTVNIMRTPALPKSAFAMAVGLVALLSLPVAAQTIAPGNSNSVAEIDAGIGACTADFTINDQNGSPIYNAKIRVHLTYGWMNLHKLDKMCIRDSR